MKRATRCSQHLVSELVGHTFTASILAAFFLLLHPRKSSLIAEKFLRIYDPMALDTPPKLRRTKNNADLNRGEVAEEKALSPSVSKWLETLDNENGPVSSNIPALALPFQRWFKFKEAFSPQFIIDCVSLLKKAPRSCLDPFGGSGTSSLTSQFLGIRPTTIEVNPFLGDLIEAKLSTYCAKSLKRDYFEVLKTSAKLKPSITSYLEGVPVTFVEPGQNNRWLFSKAVTEKIIALRESIENVKNPKNRLLLNVVLGSQLVELSNAVVNGKGRRYRKRWESRQKSGTDVELYFRQAFFEVFSDVCLYANRKCGEYTLIRGDSRLALDEVEPVDFAVLSPPYPNSFDYTDIYNIELWMMGYLRSKPDNTNLRLNTIRSHVQLNREYTSDTLGSKSLAQTYKNLCEARTQLWNPHIPEMICAYFLDMRTVMEKLKPRITKGGKSFWAVGNSKYGNVIVDTETILTEVAFSLGYKNATTAPIRSMRSSAQQGGRQELTEALITIS